MNTITTHSDNHFFINGKLYPRSLFTYYSDNIVYEVF